MGEEFLRLAFAHHEARPEHVRMRPILQELASRFGETVHYAVLEGREVVYREKIDPPTGAVRLTSTVGGRNPAHATGVGKLLLAHRLRDLGDVRAWLGGMELERRTSRTLCTAEGLHSALEQARARGFAVDDQENEVGVNCIALPVYAAPGAGPSGALSISAVAYRTPLKVLLGVVDTVRGKLGEFGQARP